MFKDTEAVIFDLDGTLIDSMWLWKDIDIHYLQRYQIELPADLQDTIEGMSFTETAAHFKERFGLPQTVEDIMNEFYAMAYQKYATEVPLKESARALLDRLKADRIPCGIATSNGMQLVDVVLDAVGIRDDIHVVRTACDVSAGKPAPDIYLKVAEELQVAPQRCLVFEDVPMGIMAGKAAGMKVCAVADAASAHQREEKRRLADYWIDSFAEILNETYEVLK